MSPFLDVALAAAQAAAEDIMSYYRGDFEVEIKTDQTPVTVADRRAEQIIRRILLGAFPDHGFFGEEGGKEQAEAEYLWLVDPIDGTKSFVGGYGMFSTQIALMRGGELVLGVSSAPAAGELAWAVSDVGAQLDGSPRCMSSLLNPGGVFSALQGRAVGLDTTSVLAATPGLHPLLLEKLNAAPGSA